jgi:ABC transporter substrate binding protein
MRRRAFIAGLGGAAAWPLMARAQQPDSVRHIGVLMTTTETDPAGQARIAAFLQGLQQLGWSVGRNVQTDTRWAAGDADRIRTYAAELVALAPDVILATGSATVGPLLQATRTVPIVFAYVPDPVGAGFVDSLARPGRNATGFTPFEYSMSGKWLELLKEITPSDASGCHSGPRHIHRARTVCSNPGRSVVGRGGSKRGERPRRRRDRPRCHRIRALIQWRPDRDRERIGRRS